MKSCELCKRVARMYCESDQASLCWDCDAEVHSANFLVARHSRTLLCRVCQSPTAWTASGAKLGPTFTVCEKCFDGCHRDDADDSEGANVEDIDVSDDGYDEDEDDEEEDEESESIDIQVVPWSPPPPTMSSSSEISSSDERPVSGKRECRRRPLKIQRTARMNRASPIAARSCTMLESLRGETGERRTGSDPGVGEFCRQSGGETAAVDLDYSETS